MVHGYITVFDDRRDSALLRGQLLPGSLVSEMQSPLYSPYGLGIVRWNDTCTNNFYYGHGGDSPGYGTISVSSADGSRQVSVSLTYPPGPFGVTDNGIVEEMTATVVKALNAAC